MIVQCAKNRAKNRIDNALRQLWRVVAPSENFVETCKSPHMKRLSSCARTYPAVGYKLYPWGARAPQSCPIDILWWGTAHETARFSYYGKVHRIFIEHNSASQCHRDMGVGLFYSGNQSDSQDYCWRCQTTPGNHLEHPSNWLYRLPIIKGPDGYLWITVS